MREFTANAWLVTRRNWAVYRKLFFTNVSPTLSDPLFAIFAFGVALGAYIKDIDGRSYLEFIGPGLAINTALFTAFFEMSYHVYIKMTHEKLYKSLMTTPLSVNEIIAGEFLWVSLKSAAMALIVSSILAVFGLVKPQFLWVMPLVGALVGLSLGSIGLLATAWVKTIDQFQVVFAVVINPMFFFSGTFYPTNNLHPYLKFASGLSPLYHGVRLAQHLLWASDVASAVLFHGGLLCLMSAALVWAASRAFYPRLYS